MAKTSTVQRNLKRRRMAKSLGMSRVVVPPSAGLFSSFGLLYADVEHHYARTFRRLLRKADLGEIEDAWTELARQALDQLASEGFTGEARFEDANEKAQEIKLRWGFHEHHCRRGDSPRALRWHPPPRRTGPRDLSARGDRSGCRPC